MQKVIPKLQSRVSQSREKGINIMEKIKGLWLGFAEKHPGASKWIREGGLFVIVSNLITVLKYFMLLFLPLAFAGLPKVDFGFPGIDITLFGETFKWKNSADATILAGKCTLMPTAKNIITTTKQIIICKRIISFSSIILSRQPGI
jgi:hypothetical protein